MKKETLAIILAVIMLVTLAACGNTDETSNNVSTALTIRLQDYSYETVEGGIRIQFYNGFDEHVTIPDTIDGLPVAEIGPSAFDGSIFLHTVVIPDTVTKIGYDAFKDCTTLTKVVLPDGLQDIGSRAFLNCILLSDITLPDGLRNIGYDVFEGCLSLSDITLPSSATE